METALCLESARSSVLLNKSREEFASARIRGREEVARARERDTSCRRRCVSSDALVLEGRGEISLADESLIVL